VIELISEISFVEVFVNKEGNIQLVQPRDTIEIHLPDGKVITGLRGLPIGEFLKIIDDPVEPIVGAVVNSELRELTYPVNMDARVHPVTMGTPDGMHIYRRSLTFLMEAAFEDLFPDAILSVDHSVASGGYFCRVEGRAPLSKDEIYRLEERMRAMVIENIPLYRREVPLPQAIAYFESKGYQDKVRLLAHRRKDYLALYRLGDHMDYHHGYMVPSTGFLKWFGLSPTDGGFTLRFPRRHRPTGLLAPPEYPKLLATFRLYGDWLELLGISNVGALNDSIQAGRINELVLVSEALHERHIADIASQIANQRQDTRIILIAGPSSSGKTTFSKRLAIQLLALGISPFPLELDNYFVNRENTPRDESGEFDFESFDALEHDLLEQDLTRLIAGERVQLPKYNFRAGQREPGETVQLHTGQMIILEGIHGMNPDLISQIPGQQLFRIYVSALTQLNLDHHNRISTTDTRLIRRIVRDATERGYSALQTIQRWESVRRGEKRHIFPYQENSDVMFNSALAYELSALKPMVEPLLRQVPFGTLEYIEAKRLLALLEWFLPISSTMIPDNSILREFLGDSILRNFRLWEKTSNT
jgi:uridine kinase